MESVPEEEFEELFMEPLLLSLKSAQSAVKDSIMPYPLQTHFLLLVLQQWPLQMTQGSRPIWPHKSLMFSVVSENHSVAIYISSIRLSVARRSSVCGTCIVLLVRASFGQPSHDLTAVTWWQFHGFGTTVTWFGIHTFMLRSCYRWFMRHTQDSLRTQSLPSRNGTQPQTTPKLKSRWATWSAISVLYEPQDGCALFRQVYQVDYNAL